jgi:transcriptional regulator with PAS, ATPase and Fis domain
MRKNVRKVKKVNNLNSLLKNISKYFKCRIIWWKKDEIIYIINHNRENKHLLPSISMLNRLLTYRHPLIIEKEKHSFCTGCPDIKKCSCEREIFIPSATTDNKRGLLLQFKTIDNADERLSDMVALFTDIVDVLFMLEISEGEFKINELYRQSVRLLGGFVEEGFVLFDSNDELIYENSTAKKIIKSYRDKVQENKKNLHNNISISNNKPNIKQKSFYFADEFLGKALYAKQGNELMEGGQVLKSKKNIVFQTIIGKNPILLNSISIAEQVAAANSTILLRGESGTGKEMFAKAIHESSLRYDKPFVAVNCAAIPENLLESELFGYEEGSFTGAKKGGKLGKFELANKGTLFLDEIGDLPLPLQAKLLRVLQEKYIERVGSTKPTYVDVRIISATHRNLEDLIKKNLFREDLFYRINVIPIDIPPLRIRREDIILLLNYYIKKYCILLNKPYKVYSQQIIEFLKAYYWKGNVRELENIVEYSVMMSKEDTIKISDMPQHLQKLYHEKLKENLEEETLIQNSEVEDIKNLLERFGTTTEDKKRIAKHLGISLATLYRRMKKYNL